VFPRYDSATKWGRLWDLESTGYVEMYELGAGPLLSELGDSSHCPRLPARLLLKKGLRPRLYPSRNAAHEPDILTEKVTPNHSMYRVMTEAAFR
jgi:hypothetical protein